MRYRRVRIPDLVIQLRRMSTTMTGSAVCAFAVCYPPSRYTGKERDSESGNDDFGARYYASGMGRWMSPDPTGLALATAENPQSLNLYAYVNNMLRPHS